jgi:hypothetical protein
VNCKVIELNARTLTIPLTNFAHFYKYGAQSSSRVVLLLQGLIHVQRHGSSSVPRFDAIVKADKIRMLFYEQLMDSGH